MLTNQTEEACSKLSIFSSSFISRQFKLKQKFNFFPLKKKRKKYDATVVTCFANVIRGPEMSTNLVKAESHGLSNSFPE